MSGSIWETSADGRAKRPRTLRTQRYASCLFGTRHRLRLSLRLHPHKTLPRGRENSQDISRAGWTSPGMAFLSLSAYVWRAPPLFAKFDLLRFAGPAAHPMVTDNSGTGTRNYRAGSGAAYGANGKSAI